jgi:hypothetical protein
MKKHKLIINTSILSCNFFICQFEEVYAQSFEGQGNNADRSIVYKSLQADSLFVPWAQSNSPGIAVLVMKDGKVIYNKGFGLASIETKYP